VYEFVKGTLPIPSSVTTTEALSPPHFSLATQWKYQRIGLYLNVRIKSKAERYPHIYYWRIFLFQKKIIV
jgi:hypothetical protein